jgi:hypothetical protein
MISGSIFPNRLTEIDDLARPDHSYLVVGDDCYFLGEYTARKGFAHSVTNRLIINFKKRMDRRGRPEWPYKAAAIQQAATAFRSALNDQARATLTFVPVPPSKAKGDPFYDDRLTQMLHTIWPGQSTDIRELVVQPTSTDAVHDQGVRPSPTELQARYALDACRRRSMWRISICEQSFSHTVIRGRNTNEPAMNTRKVVDPLPGAQPRPS